MTDRFDVVVIGAGIQGAGVAQAAAAFRLDAAPVVMIGPSSIGGALSRARPGRFAMITPQ